MMFPLFRGFRITRITNPETNPITSRRRPEKASAVIGILILSLMFDIFSGDARRRKGWMFADFAAAAGGGGAGGGGGGGGGGFWNSGVIPASSNVGIAIVVTAMAGLALAATVVYSRRILRRMLMMQDKPLLKALRRSQTSFWSANVSSSRTRPSWIHLRSVLLVVASSSSSSSTTTTNTTTSSSSSPLTANRGSLKSPWSRRRRKHALLPKQWKSYFDEEGRLLDGGVKFLKKARSGGVDPSIRAEVWPFLLGVYDVKTTKKEKDVIKAQKRKEYISLRRRCQHLSNQSFKSKEETFEDESNAEDSGDLGEVLNSPGLEEEIASARTSVASVYANGLSPECEEKSKSSDGDVRETDKDIPLDKDNGTPLDEDCKSAITTENAGEPETDSSDSDSSAEAEETQPLISQGSTESNDLCEASEQNFPKSDDSLSSQKSEDFITWQRIIRLDAVRANAEWALYSPSQASVSEEKAKELAEGVGLKDYDHLEPCRIYHAARLVAILEAYALYDPEIGYCQGMSDLLSPIITVMEDNIEAFWCFVGFMQKARHNFRLDEVGIRRQLNIVAKIIKSKDSHLYRHLEKLEAEDCFFVYRMVVVLFRRELDFEQVLCLWEVMWADQAAIRAGISKSTWGRLRSRAPPTEDLLLYAIAASVLQKRKLIIEKYSSMDEIIRECNSMAGHLDIWKLLDDAHDLVVTLHDKIQP